MKRLQSLRQYLFHVDRRASLKLLGTGYALMLFGAALAGANADWLTACGMTALGLGGLILLLGAGFYARHLVGRARWSQQMDESLPELGSAENYLPNHGVGRLSRPGDVEQVIDLATASIDASLFYDVDQLCSFIAVNPGALRCIRTDKRSMTRLTGYYILLALTPRGEGLIKDGAVDVGVAMTADLTLRDPIDAGAFYIGMFQGIDGIGAAEIIRALTAHLDQLASEAGGPIRIYGRRGNPVASGRYMDRLGFKPLIIDGQVAKIEWTEIVPGQLSPIVESHRRQQEKIVGRYRDQVIPAESSAQ